MAWLRSRAVPRERGHNVSELRSRAVCTSTIRYKKKQANLLRGGEDFHRVKMPKAALKLDTEKRQGRLLAKVVVFLKENDPDKKTRKRKVPVV